MHALPSVVVRWLLLIALVVCSSTTAVSTAGAQRAPTKAQLASLLSGYEDVPSGEQLRALGPQTLAVLIDLYADRQQPTFVRARAVASVAHFPTPATRTFLLGVAQAPGQTDLFIRRAVLSLGQAFGSGAIDDLRPFLAHRMPVVRRSAITALSRIDHGRARTLLRDRMGAEADPVVRRALARALSTPPR